MKNIASEPSHNNRTKAIIIVPKEIANALARDYANRPEEC